MNSYRWVSHGALLGALAFTLAACAAPVSPPAASDAYLETQLAADANMVVEAEKPLVLRLEPAGAESVSHVDVGGPGQDVVRVRYAQSVEETVLWEGSGQGVAELKNEAGEVIYRVTEGGDAFKGTIAAGLYTLTLVGGDAAEPGVLVVEPKVEAAGHRRVIFWQPEGDDSRGGWRV